MFLLGLWTMRTLEKWPKQHLNKASIINHVYCVDKSHVYIYTYIHNSYTGTRCRDFWRQKVITWWWKNFCATLTPKTYRTTILANSLNPSRQQKLRLCVCMKIYIYIQSVNIIYVYGSIYIYTCASFWIEKRAYKETWRHQKMIVNIEGFQCHTSFLQTLRI